MAQPTLLVVVNRYICLDHHGRPAGAVILDAGAPAGRPRYIGARFVAEPIEEKRAEIPNLNLPKQDGRLEFVDGPVTVPDSDHHRQAMRTGELFAADLATHRKVFGAQPFVPPEERLAASRAKAIADWQAEHNGDLPSFVATEAAAPVRGVPTPPAAQPGAAAEPIAAPPA